MYKYFISYFYTTKNNKQFGLGNCKVERAEKIKNINDLHEIETDFKEIQKDFETIIILNYKLFEEE